MQNNLTNFIKYCLGYVKLTRAQAVLSQLKYSVNIPAEYLSLEGLLNGEADGSLRELINFSTFYKYDPKNVPVEEQEQYNNEKELVGMIEDIYNKYRNDQFTKQVLFNFGYFEIELPIEIEGEEVESVENGDEPTQQVLLPQTKIDRYPLFAIPIAIEKEFEEGVAKYYASTLDPEIQVNIGMLQSILGDDLYFQLLEELGKYETEEKLTLPVLGLDIFKDIWHNIKAQLKNTDANFNEESFSLNEIKIALSPRANYFLAEDLAKLSKLTEEELIDTSLTSWADDTDLNIQGDVPVEKELFFPFKYDKYQLQTLSIVGNKVAIIQGPPGTGKSETIANLLCHFAATKKRVLFVSQKAQALKVVKDKLKKLDVHYLYGYLPNPASAQIGEEDEADGIAPQLAGLGAHIEKLGYAFGWTKKTSSSNGRKFESIEDAVQVKGDLKDKFNTAVENQRTYYQLSNELKGLKDYDIDITNFESFVNVFSSDEWNEIKRIKFDIETVNGQIGEYEKNGEKKKFEKLFTTLDLHGTKYSVPLKKLLDDVAKTGYDRHTRILRIANNELRKVRLGEIRKELPGEIIDYIDKLLASDILRSEAVKSLTEIYNHCSYYENLLRLDEGKKLVENKLSSCGVSHEEFQIIDKLIDESKSDNLDEVKEKVVRAQEIKKELKTLISIRNANEIVPELQSTEQARSKQVAIYLQNIINSNISEKWKQGPTIRGIIQKLSKAFGKSKKAFKTFDNLRKDPHNFSAILDLIPVWIMELDDASRIVPLDAGIFDYVILDEASQCNVAYTLPVMYRSKKTLFVGDSEQMRDSTVRFKSNRVFDELARRYQIPEEHQIKATGSAVQSVLDIAKNRGFMYRTLRYHYRSPKELIGFSNQYFYKPNGKELIPLNNNYLTYKDTNRVMVIHEVASDWSQEISDNVNVEEAQLILGFFKELKSDERYSDKSIGILAFFNAQAAYIRDLFEKEGFKEEDDNFKVSIVEGIQGDEKDIIVYSFVIRSSEQARNYRPLTGEGGDIQADINKGRVNVAFSRARLQTHCFVSMPIKDLPDRIWIKKYLEYVNEEGEVAFNSTELKDFDSYFEEEFYQLLKNNLKRKYKIQNQVESCGFKIDFVVSNSETGKKIAIECDGPTHFEDEIDEAYGIRVESDDERQSVLEAAGWNFYRIKYSDWIEEGFERDSTVKDVASLLD